MLLVPVAHPDGSFSPVSSSFENGSPRTLSGCTPSCPFPFSQPDFRVAHRGRHFRDSGCSHLGSACYFLPASPTLPPARPSPSPCPHSFITLSFLPFAASCPFDALVLFCVRTFPSLFPLFQGLWAFLLILFFLFLFPLQLLPYSILAIPSRFSLGCFGFEFTATLLLHNLHLAIFTLLPILCLFREEGRLR